MTTFWDLKTGNNFSFGGTHYRKIAFELATRLSDNTLWIIWNGNIDVELIDPPQDSGYANEPFLPHRLSG